MEMDKEIIIAKPGPEAQKLNESAYKKLADISYELSDYLRKMIMQQRLLTPMAVL